jgi:hypothetical protein
MRNNKDGSKLVDGVLGGLFAAFMIVVGIPVGLLLFGGALVLVWKVLFDFVEVLGKILR